MQSIDHLFVNATVVTMDAERRVIDNGAVAVSGNRIVAVGPNEEVEARFTAQHVHDATRKVLLPGLIDCHGHAGHALVKTLGGDDSARWYGACEQIYLRGSDHRFWEAEARLAALERLKFGVTTNLSLFGGGDSISRSDDSSYADHYFTAVDDVGVRSILAIGGCRAPSPVAFTDWHDGDATVNQVTFDEQMAVCEEVIARWHGANDGQFQVAIVAPIVRGLDSADSSERKIARAQIEQNTIARDLSRQHALLFTQDGHRAETVLEAESQGLLGPDALFSHSIDLGPEEIAACARSDTRIIHNPSAVAAINGRCPVPELIDAGVTVVIGTDAAAPDRSYDMFKHMQQCMHYHRTFFKDRGYLPPGKVLEMVTIDAARALGMDAEIGSIESGKRADLILVDLFKPHTMPFQMPLYRTVYFANGNDVDTVMVDGRMLMSGRDVQSLDESEVLLDADLQARLMIERNGLQDLLRDPENLWGKSHY